MIRSKKPSHCAPLSGPNNSRTPCRRTNDSSPSCICSVYTAVLRAPQAPQGQREGVDGLHVILRGIDQYDVRTVDRLANLAHERLVAASTRQSPCRPHQAPICRANEGDG